MKAISIRQPYAWLILHAGKTVENRGWLTTYRGALLVHTGKMMTREDYADGLAMTQRFCPSVSLPAPDTLPLGGIVGQVTLIDCVQASDSPWFFGRYGFILANPLLYRPLPCRGFLGLFEVPDALLAQLEVVA